MRSAMQKMMLLTLVILFFLTGAAQANGPFSVEAEIGYEGRVTYLSVMPLRVSLKNAGNDAAVTVAVNVRRSDTTHDRYEYPVTLAGGAEREIVLPLTLNYRQDSYTVELLENGETVASAKVRPQQLLSPSTLLVGVLSDTPEAMSYMNINQANDQLLRGDVWQTVALSRESFPDTVQMLRAFRILAVDGVDMSTFSQAQRDALDTWLCEGGIVIVGGGARAVSSLRAFSGYTGVTTGAPYAGEQVENALISYLDTTQFALSAVRSNLQGKIMLSPLNGASGAVVEQAGQTLLDRCPVENGVVYTAAFALSDKTLSAWDGMTCFWQRVLLSADSAAYQRIIEALGNYYRDEYVTVTQNLMSAQPLENDRGVLYAVVFAAAVLVFSGIGSYLILKRLDRREWMWLTVPVLAAVCVGILQLISGGILLNRPAAAGYAVLRRGAAGDSQYQMVMGVAAKNTEPVRVSTVEKAHVEPVNTSDYYSDDTAQKLTGATSLRYTYTIGTEGTAVTLPSVRAWEVQYVCVTPEKAPEADVSGSIWWEEDGLHGKIVNRSELTLQAGYVITSFGYCTIPEVYPGETRTFALLENNGRTEPGIYDGEIAQLWMERYTGSILYSVVYAAVYPEDPQLERELTLDPREETLRNNLRQMINACSNQWNDEYYAQSTFHYITFSDSLGSLQLMINGGKAERMAYSAAIDVQLDYLPVNEAGQLRCMRGMIPVYSAGRNSDGTPYRSGSALTGYHYFSLRDEPVLCFALGEVKGLQKDEVTISKIEFACEQYGSNPRIRLFCPETGKWDEVSYTQLPLYLAGEDAMRYLDEKMQLYILLSMPSGVSNAEIGYATLAVEGTVK